MSDDAHSLLLKQMHSNLLLGELQDWANSCPGDCYEL